MSTSFNSKVMLALSAVLVLGAISQASAQTVRKHGLRSMPEAAFALSNTSRTHSTMRSYDAYNSQGTYVGSDPDPLVRAQLQRDPPGRGD